MIVRNQPKQIDTFDKTDVYEKTLKPLINEIVNVCSINRIPLFITVAPSNNEKETKYYNDGVLTGSREIHLYDDKIKHHMLISGGCVAVSPAHELTIDMDVFNMDEFDEINADDFNEE